MIPLIPQTTPDIHLSWEAIKANFFGNQKDRYASAPGAFNDPDMLEIGVKTGINLQILS
jgi:hypothetical protein